MSLRSKLVLSFAAVILLALGLAGAASVALRWQGEQQARLDRLAVASPQLTYDLFRLQRQGASTEQIGEFVREAARQQDVRVLLMDRNGTVTVDSGDTLRGKRLDVPADNGRSPALTYHSWHGASAEQKGLVFLSARTLPERRGGGRIFTLPEPTETVVLAVPKQTVTRAWLRLLPGLAWAGLMALAVSAIVAMLLARSIAHPLQALTHASEEMARGNYDQEIALRRNDEVGRLAAAFNGMARQVGRSHVQMRTLIANVSHDLKTPLTSILGFAQALRDGAVEGPEQTVETGAIIHEEAERVQALVDDLLYLSEIEARQVVLAHEPVDLGALAARSARRFEPSLQERGVTLTVGAPAATHRLVVNGDSAKLERVLDNLLDNACKYTPEGGRVEVRTADVSGAPPAVRLQVFNTGSFIPPEDLPRVFERFYRLDRTRARAGGSGLGLAIAKELAELHGGSLTASSDASGVTFALTLPRAATITSVPPGGTAAPPIVKPATRKAPA
jgi:signal transduction histidine kinase